MHAIKLESLAVKKYKHLFVFLLNLFIDFGQKNVVFVVVVVVVIVALFVFKTNLIILHPLKALVWIKSYSAD